MAKNKIVYGNETLIDLTDDTVSANNLLSGATAHDRSGTSIVGSVTVPSDLDDLSDVTISSPTDGQALVYDDTDDLWKNASLSIPGALNDLSDVNISQYAQNGQVLKYDTSSQKWKNANANYLSIYGGTVTGDVTVTKSTSATYSELKVGGGSYDVKGYLEIYAYGGDFAALEYYGGDDVSVVIPSKNGTIALTSDLPSDFVPASTGGTFEGDVTIDKADGTTSVVGQSKIILGNSTLATTDENSKGVMRVYTRGSKYVDICAPDNLNYADNRELNVPDKSGTIATTSDVSAIDLTKGGTIKADSGNTFVTIDGATSSNYGQLQLKRGTYAARLTAANNLSTDRDFSFPNVSGSVVVSKDYGTTYTATGSGSTLSNYETWKSLFNRVRTGSFSGAIRRSQLLVSSFDGQANIIFSCQRYQSANYSIWGSFRGSGTAMVWYIVTFSSSNTVAVYKHVITTTSGLAVTTLTNEPAATESDGTITPVTITLY